MALTAKQSRFAELVAGGLNLSESYRRAYDAQGMSSGAIRVEAHRLSRHPKIVIAVKALRQGCPKTKRQVAEASKEWVEIRLEVPFVTISSQVQVFIYLPSQFSSLVTMHFPGVQSTKIDIHANSPPLCRFLLPVGQVLLFYDQPSLKHSGLQVQLAPEVVSFQL